MNQGKFQPDGDRNDLTQILDSEKMESRFWTDSEQGAILRHQLNAPVGYDLGNMGPQTIREIRALREHDHFLVESFSSLFRHPHPPLELLKLTKSFAKKQLVRSVSLLPREIARVLYLTSIAVAWLKCGERITKLDDVHIRQGLEWGLEQTWLEPEIREIFRQMLEGLDSCPPAT